MWECVSRLFVGMLKIIGPIPLTITIGEKIFIFFNLVYWFRGERKIWYGIAGKDAEKFDKIVKQTVPDLFVEQPDLLHHMTTALNPRFLISKGLSVYTVHQNAGEFVITFPRAYHAGYNEGLNFAEAVNFAPPDWVC